MTIDDAVKILNERRHKGHAKWYVNGPSDEPDTFVHGNDEYEYFTQFEAIAVAEKYAREARNLTGMTPVLID